MCAWWVPGTHLVGGGLPLMQRRPEFELWLDEPLSGLGVLEDERGVGAKKALGLLKRECLHFESLDLRVVLCQRLQHVQGCLHQLHVHKLL